MSDRAPDVDQQIEAALRRQPADEPDYEAPLTALLPRTGVTRGRGSTRGAAGLGNLPILVVIALGIAGLGVAMVGVPGLSTGGSSNDYQLTGKVGCFGQGPGWEPGSSDAGQGCQVMPVPPQGYGAASWTLDPAYPFSPDATDIHVLVTEWECHGDASAAGRIVKNVQYTSDGVVVTLAVRQLSGPQTCPMPPPTPYVLVLDQPLGPRALLDGGIVPATLIATGGAPFFTPSPTPTPSNWHEPMACNPAADTEARLGGFFKAASMITAFDVYCLPSPDGWTLQSSNEDQLSGVSNIDLIEITYAGPNGQIFSLKEGRFCEAAGAICDLAWAPIGTAMFGDREATLGGGDGQWYAYTAVDGGFMWQATCGGMSLDDFEALAASLIVVAK
jgi:hypothetical protein